MVHDFFLWLSQEYYVPVFWCDIGYGMEEIRWKRYIFFKLLLIVIYINIFSDI